MRQADRGAPRHRRGLRKLVVALSAVVVLFAICTARLFAWPSRGMPARVDAIVMLNGPGDRLGAALPLARAHRAPTLVISEGGPYWPLSGVCEKQIAGVRLICFVPQPQTTRGEAEFVGRLGRRFHWRTIALVTTTPQATRGRLRVGRCFSGKVYVMTAPLPLTQWPYAIAYEWAASAKALLLQRSC